MKSNLARLFTACCSGWLGAAGFLTVVSTAPAAASLQTVLVEPGLSGAGFSAAPLFTGDGRFVVFLSHANNLVENDDQAFFMDVFVRELETGLTTLVSGNTSGIGGGNADSGAPSASASGRWIAFESAATDLVSGDTNGVSDIFVRDLETGVTVLASRAWDGALGNGQSRRPLLSADGRLVFFESAACNLAAASKAPASVDVFARNLESGEVFLASPDTNGSGGLAWNSRTELCSITADGRKAAIISARPGLGGGVTNSLGDVYVRDTQAGSTCWASDGVAALLGVAAPAYRCFGAVLSADGASVVFKAETAGPGASGSVWVFWRDLTSGATEVLWTNSLLTSWPALSADGRVAAFEAGTPAQPALWTWDALERRSDPVDAALSASRSAVLSADGGVIGLVGRSTEAGFYQVYAGSRRGEGAPGYALRLMTAGADGAAVAVDHQTAAVALTPDGARAAFDSAAETLDIGDNNLALDVFVRGLDGSGAQLVSRRHRSIPALTSAAGVWEAGPQCMDAGGRLLAFTTWNNNLAARDTNWSTRVAIRDLTSGTNLQAACFTNSAGLPVLSADGRYLAYVRPPYRGGSGGGIGYKAMSDVWRYDLARGVAEQVTVDSTGAPVFPPRASGPAAISGDGRLVAFAAGQGAWVAGLPSTSLNQIYVRDMAAGSNQLASWNSSHTGGSGGYASNPMFAPDGAWVLFESTAADLVSPSIYGLGLQLYAWNVSSNAVRALSFDPAARSGLGYAAPVAVSANSRVVVFGTVSNRVYAFDLASGRLGLVAEDAANPSVSGDGRFVAVETRGTGPAQIVLWDRATGESNLVSSAGRHAGAGNGPSESPVITPNGRYVLFSSRASNLVADDDNGTADIFVWDRLRGATWLASRGVTGRPGRGASNRPVLSPDGATAVFSSAAPDLVAGDFNDARDLFVLRFTAPDTDADGMDDDWEIAAFSTLDRDGSGDFDADGLSDLDEFRAGTNPAGAQSLLRVWVLSLAQGGPVTVFWEAAPGRAYRVQYKDTLSAPAWTDLPARPAIFGTAGAVSDPTPAGPGQRFYRVQALP